VKTNYTISVLFLLLFSVQLHSQCELPDNDAFSELINDHRITYTRAGGAISSFSDINDAYYVHPVIPIFNSYTSRGLWMGGYDTLGNLSIAISTYDHTRSTDHQVGPIVEVDSTDQEAFCTFYNRIWTILEQDIIELKELFSISQLRESDIPLDILQWPAKNNPHNGKFAIDYDMAPFFDFNSDGDYDPLDGDYPIALQEQPEFSAYTFNFSVYNDNVPHSLSRGQRIVMETHLTKYLTQCPSTTELDKSIFHRVKYIYKGDKTYNNFKIGLWEDGYLGCAFNNLIGCSEELNATYTYAPDSDRLFCDPTDQALGSAYAIKSSVILSHDIKSFQPFFNPNIGNNIPQTTDPRSTIQYYYLLDSKWIDGRPLTYGGSGYDTTGTGTPTNIAYPDFPNDENGWSMLTDSVHFTDVRAVTKIEDTILTPGQEGIIDFADHISYSTRYEDESMFELYPDIIDNLRKEYNDAINGRLDCNISPCAESCVWPGDINGDNLVGGEDIIISGVYAGRGRLQGPSREYESIRWNAFTSDDWDPSLSIADVNAKYADVNGDGIIEYSDFYYTTNNYGRSHSNYEIENEELTTEGDVNLTVRMDKEFVDFDTANLLVRLFTLDVFLGEEGVLLEEPIHGLSFEMQLDTNIIESFGSRIWVDEDNVFQYHKAIEHYNTIENGYNLIDDSGPIILSNYNGIDQGVGFKILNHNYIIKPDLTTNNPDGRDTVKVKFYNVKAINSAGQYIDIGSINDEIIITNVEYRPPLSSTDHLLHNNPTLVLYPNPVDDVLKIKSEESMEGILTVIDMYGKNIMAKRISASESNIDVSDICSGVYLIHYKSTQGTEYMSKFIKT